MKKFEIGQIVYLVTDKEQEKRMVTAIVERQSGLLYELSCGLDISSHYDFEISADEDTLQKVL